VEICRLVCYKTATRRAHLASFLAYLPSQHWKSLCGLRAVCICELSVDNLGSWDMNCHDHKCIIYDPTYKELVDLVIIIYIYTTSKFIESCSKHHS
jgi:hypothetical protein